MFTWTPSWLASAVSGLIDHVCLGGSAQPKIPVGGYLFNIAPGLWQQVGADGYAPNARQEGDVLHDAAILPQEGPG